MSYEEAIEILQEERDWAQHLSYVNKALEMAKEAMEKQIAKKPIARTTMLFCPTCKKSYCSRHYSHEGFCKHCGQHIADWSDEE